MKWPRSPKLRARARPRMPDAFRAWACMTLNVDPGTHCGVAVYNEGAYVDSGAGDGFDHRWLARWIDNAVFYANAVGKPLVLVMERPPRGGAPYPGRNPSGAASVIGCRKLWLHAWAEHAPVKRLRADVYPVTWRSRTLGLSSGSMLERAEFMRAAHLSGKDVQSRDEAAAVLIGEWSARAGVVGAVLRPQPRRRVA